MMTDEGKLKRLEATLSEIVDAIEPLAVTMGAYAALSRAAVALMSERLGIPADEIRDRALALIDVPAEEVGPVAALMDAILETSAAPVPLGAARH